MTFQPLPAEVDYDDANLDAWLPGRKRFRGLAAGRYDIIGIFIRPLRSQYYAVTDALASGSYDAVVSETAFLGVLPVLLSVPAGDRIPIAGVSATPLSVTSVDCAPFGSGIDPGRSAHTRRRNRLLNAVLQRGPLKPIQDGLDDALAGLGLPAAADSYFDQVTKFDVTFHLAVSAFEYPRRELPPTVRFVGPLRSTDPEASCLPSWWADLARLVAGRTCDPGHDGQHRLRQAGGASTARARERERIGGGLDWRSAGFGPAGAAGWTAPLERAGRYIPALRPAPSPHRCNDHQRWIRRRATCAVLRGAAGRRRDHRGQAGGGRTSGLVRDRHQPAHRYALARPTCAEPLGRRSPTRATGSKPRVCGARSLARAIPWRRSRTRSSRWCRTPVRRSATSPLTKLSRCLLFRRSLYSPLEEALFPDSGNEYPK